MSRGLSVRPIVALLLAFAASASARNFRAKVKSPLEFVLSMRRILNAEPDVDAEGIDFLVRLEQPPYGRASPDGWPETGGPWMNVGAMGARLDIATRVAHGEVKSINPELWPEWTRLVSASPGDQMNGVINSLLGGQLSAQARTAFAAAAGKAGQSPTTDEKREILRELIALALGSPEFQRR